MPEPHLLAFVDSIAAAPTVRLDLSGGVRGPFNLREGSRFDPPPLKRAIPASLLADGGVPVAAAYDNRTIELRLQIMSGGILEDADSSATYLQLLQRELDRSSNILRYQAGTSTPVFFRTYRAGPDSIDFDPNNRELVISLLAEPFAYGIEETLSTVTVWNDPAEGTTLNANPFFETVVTPWLPNGGSTTFVRSTAQFHEGVASGLLTPDGVTSGVDARSENVTVVPNVTYRASAWVRCAVSRTIGININWRDAGASLLGTTSGTLAVTANTWTFISLTGSHASAVLGQITLSMGSTPAAGNLLYIDEARLRRVGGDGGMCFDIASPKGDVDTPLNLAIASGGIVATGRRRTALSTRRRGTPANVAIVMQAESMTQGTATSTQANSTLMSGPSGDNYSRVTFAGSAAMTQRLSGTFPPTASVDARGTYRVFARVRQNTTTDTFALRLRWGGVDVQRTGATTNIPVDTGPSAPTIKWVELDVVQIPVDYDPVYRGPSGVEIATEGLFVALDAQRITGAGTLDIDCLMFLPSDENFEMITWPAAAGAPTVIDYMAMGGPTPTAYARNGSGQIVSTESIEIAGQGLMITPGRTNRIYVARDSTYGTAVTGAGDDITGSTTVTPSYFPRYLSPVRPVST